VTDGNKGDIWHGNAPPGEAEKQFDEPPGIEFMKSQPNQLGEFGLLMDLAGSPTGC